MDFLGSGLHETIYFYANTFPPSAYGTWPCGITLGRGESDVHDNVHVMPRLVSVVVPTMLQEMFSLTTLTLYEKAIPLIHCIYLHFS